MVKTQILFERRVLTRITTDLYFDGFTEFTRIIKNWANVLKSFIYFNEVNFVIFES